MSYTSGIINIPNVTGNIVITATATIATVSSISAVFSQGQNVVYDTDSLDTLRQYLTVTATYSDSSTAAVTNYTLSGTLAEGTSTITVSYGGQTDTFTVIVSKAPAAPLYEWDLKTSMTDIKQSVTATTTAVFTEGTGVVFANTQRYVDFGAVYARDRTYEIDVASMGAGASTAHRRIIAFDTDSNTSTGGAALVYRHGYGWRFYTGSAWDATELSGQDDELIFSGKTVKLYLDEDGYAHVSYKTIGADDSTYVTFGTSTSVFNDFTGGHVYVGGSTNDSVAAATISGLRIYEGEK